MTDERLEAIRGRVSQFPGTRVLWDDVEPDLRYLLDRIEAQREVVAAAPDPERLEAAALMIRESAPSPSEWESEYHKHHSLGRNLETDAIRLRDALNNLEEQTDE